MQGWQHDTKPGWRMEDGDAPLALDPGLLESQRLLARVLQKAGNCQEAQAPHTVRSLVKPSSGKTADHGPCHGI